MDDLLLPYSCLNDEEFASMLEYPSRDISNDYKNVYFDPIGPSDRYANDPLMREEFNVLQSLYFDLDDMPSMPPTDTEEFSVYIMSYNIVSVPRNLEVFFADIFHLPVDIFGLCETRLISDLEPLYYLDNFDTFSCSRNTYGGGVQLYVRKFYHSEKVHDLTFMHAHLEVVFIRFKKSGKDYLVGQFYRPPGADLSSFLVEFTSILQTISVDFMNSIVYLMGDFNINLLQINSNAKYLDYYSLLLSFGYLPAILRPTRVRPTSSTLIDQIWTNNHKAICISGQVEYDLTDHKPVFAIAKYKHNDRSNDDEVFITKSYRLINEAGHSRFSQLIGTVNWSLLSNIEEVDLLYDKFNTLITDAFCEAYPIVTARRKKVDEAKPYINNELKRLILQKNKLYKKYRKYPITYGEAYRQLRNQVTTQVRLARTNYYRQRMVLSSNNSSKAWRLLGEMLGNKPKDTNVVMLNSQSGSHTSNSEIAQNFNEYFSLIGERLSSEFHEGEAFLRYLDDDFSGLTFNFRTITLEELYAVVKNFKTDTAGADDLPMYIYSKNFDVLGKIILDVCNKSLCQGKFPTKLKTAKVIPIYKTGEKTSVGNYRPISLVPTFSKIIEKVVSNQLLGYFDDHCLLTSAQFGFRPNLSTEKALHSLLDDIYSNFDKGNYVVGLFLDLTKAFDSINRHILLKKLAYYGIRGVANNWFTSYMSDRKQFVFVNGFRSTLRQISAGVVQGSILGPLLFIIYINDLVKSSRLLKFSLYADDTSLSMASNDLGNLMGLFSSEVALVDGWFRANYLTLNPSKSNYIIFHRDKKKVPTMPLSLSIGGQEVERVTVVRFLGVLIDECLKFGAHVNGVACKVSRYTPILYKLRRYLDTDSLKLMYHSMIYSNITYCISAWGAGSASVIGPLLVSQKAVIRAVLGRPRFAHTRELYQQLKLLTIDQIYNYMVALYVRKSIESGVTEEFRIRDETGYSLRNIDRTTLTVPFSDSSHSQRSIKIAGAKVYNSIPLNVKSAESYTTYKVNLKKFLLRGGY